MAHFKDKPFPRLPKRVNKFLEQGESTSPMFRELNPMDIFIQPVRLKAGKDRPSELPQFSSLDILGNDLPLLEKKISAWRLFFREFRKILEEVLALPAIKTDIRKAQELRIMLRSIDKL